MSQYLTRNPAWREYTFFMHFFCLTSYRVLVRSDNQFPGKQYCTIKDKQIRYKSHPFLLFSDTCQQARHLNKGKYILQHSSPCPPFLIYNYHTIRSKDDKTQHFSWSLVRKLWKTDMITFRCLIRTSLERHLFLTFAPFPEADRSSEFL